LVLEWKGGQQKELPLPVGGIRKKGLSKKAKRQFIWMRVDQREGIT